MARVGVIKQKSQIEIKQIKLENVCELTLPGLNSGKSSVTAGRALAASFCMMPARGSVRMDGLPPPGP